MVYWFTVNQLFQSMGGLTEKIVMGEEIEFSENQNQLQKKGNNPESKQQEEDDEQVLKFMDSLDSYLSLLHSLSSTLRQGWFEFASARYSMGSSRVNGVLLDLKEHPAATYLEVGTDEEPQFTLCKWASTTEDSIESKFGDGGLNHGDNMRQRHKDKPKPAEAEGDSSPFDEPVVTEVDQMQKERVKSLAVFGTLVSPKLRSTQSSFETALETLVEIANVRASMLSSFDKLRESAVDVSDVKN